MSTTETERPQARYALGHSPQEYDRLRTQARVWEDATGKLLDRVGLGPGASCLDAGCGPGETMRLMAERAGPSGRVVGIDTDASLGAMALETLHYAGATELLAAIDRDAARFADCPMGWPLLIGAWKRKEPA